jgi:hypothetical protein
VVPSEHDRVLPGETLRDHDAGNTETDHVRVDVLHSRFGSTYDAVSAAGTVTVSSVHAAEDNVAVAVCVLTTAPVVSTAWPRRDTLGVPDTDLAYTLRDVTCCGRYGGAFALSGINTLPDHIPSPTWAVFVAPVQRITPDVATGVVTVVSNVSGCADTDADHAVIACNGAPNVDACTCRAFRHAGSTKQNGPSPNTPA